MSKNSYPTIKKFFLFFFFFLLSTQFLQAAPSRCSYSSASSYYSAVSSWVNSESSSASGSYLSGRASEAQSALSSMQSCAISTTERYSCGKDGDQTCTRTVLDKTEQAAKNMLDTYYLSAYKRSVFLQRSAVYRNDTGKYESVSGCTSRSVSQTGYGGDWGVFFYITCGSTVYKAYVGCLNDQYWFEFAYNLCTPYTPSCTTAYPYTSESSAKYDGSCYWNISSTTYYGSCGGSNKTCWRRNSRIPVQGYCPSWTYTSYSSANYYNGCYYNVSSTSGTGAKCGGSNPTCYVRGSIIPVNGVCYNPYSANNRTNLGFGFDGGIGGNYSGGARCTGVNPYCGYTCQKPTCPGYSPLAPGYPNPITADTGSNSPCGKPSHTIFTSVNIKHGGTLNCYNGNSTKDGTLSVCHQGAYPRCYKLKSCSDINPSFPDEFTSTNSPNYIFVPDEYGNAGINGLRCGKYYPTDASWWQAMGTNIYANGKIEAIDKPNFSQLCQSSDNCSQYIIRTTDDSCGSSGNNSAGIALVSGNFGDIKPSQAITNRFNKNTSAYPAFDASSFNPKYNYEYFFGLLGKKADNCRGNVANEGAICKQGGDMTISSQFDATGTHIVFVEGDLFINAPIIVPEGKYLAFIVNGSIYIGYNVGEPITTNKCISKGSGHIQGVYITDKDINIESNPTPYLSDFNQDTKCDKSLVLEGIFASWGNINFKRTFKGCGTNGQGIIPGRTYPNYNATNPTETIIYRPDFVTNTPDWMKQPKMMRLETI